MGITFFFPWEVDFMVHIQGVCGPIINKIAELLSMIGEEMVMVALLGFLYWCLDKRLAKRIGLIMIVGLMSGSMLKNFIMRRRPYFDHSQIKCIHAPHPHDDPYDLFIQDFSFPSLHSALSLAMFYPIAFAVKKKWTKALLFTLPILVGISRVILGVHYPTDVLGGWALGLVLLRLMDFILAKTDNYLAIGGILTLLGLPGWFISHTNEFFTIYGLLVGMIIGFWFETKYVNFENTRKPFNMVFRIIGGMLLFFGSTSLLKLPFSKDFLGLDALLPHIIRSIRYAFGIFVVMALYPMLFSRSDDRPRRSFCRRTL